MLIVDADDTLWESEIFYEQCIAAFAELMAAQGFEREEAERTASAVERERVPLVGYGPREFARNLVIACRRLCERYDRPVEDEMVNAVWEIGQVVIEPPIVLLDGVAETLARLRRGCHLLLFDGVHVVPEKDAGVIRDLLVHYRLRPERTWMVGNSPRSDVNPALEAGIGAVYVPHPNTWDLEQEEIADPERVVVISRFAELAALFLDAADGPEACERV
jgi:putative hydrolase of the HAD superfamily